MVTYLGSFVQLCCGERGTLQKKKKESGMCGDCLQCMDHTGFAPAHSGVYCLGLHCSGCRVLCKGTTRLGVRFLPFPCPSSSGNQVFGKRTVPGGPCILITSPVPAVQFPGGPARALSQPCVSWGADLRLRPSSVQFSCSVVSDSATP